MAQISNCHTCGSTNVKKESNAIIYGREYGNGKCYYCHDCKASVGTHDSGKPLGTLAKKDVHILRKTCHEIFDKLWRFEKVSSRGHLYGQLAKRLNIPNNECHFGMMQRDRCLEALYIITIEGWWKDEM